MNIIIYFLIGLAFVILLSPLILLGCLAIIVGMAYSIGKHICKSL